MLVMLLVGAGLEFSNFIFKVFQFSFYLVSLSLALSQLCSGMAGKESFNLGLIQVITILKHLCRRAIIEIKNSTS